MDPAMAKLVARTILVTIIGFVIVMTYLALTGNEPTAPEAEFKTWLERQSPDRLPVFERHRVNRDSKRVEQKRLDDPMSRPPIQKINVAYPLEIVPGLQEVVAGNHVIMKPNDASDQANVSASLDALDDLKMDAINGQVNGSAGFLMPLMEGQNIISMTLYGSSPRYTMGALRNAELIKVNFPGWKLRIYTETPSASKYGAIPKNIMESLRALGVDFYFMQPGEDFIPPMMWRFLIADDTWVDHFIVRDSDSRLTRRDAAAVYAWLKTDKPFTCIRDHPSHASYAISGGMWGGKPRELRNLLRRSWKDLMRGVPSHYLEDMNFLEKVIWPKVQSHAFCLDSVSCDRWPGAHPFPVPRYGYEHVGQVVNEHDLGRPVDLQLLRKAGENQNCTPRVKAGH